MKQKSLMLAVLLYKVIPVYWNGWILISIIYICVICFCFSSDTDVIEIVDFWEKHKLSFNGLGKYWFKTVFWPLQEHFRSVSEIGSNELIPFLNK